MKGQVGIRTFTRSAPPRLPYENVASSVLPGWEVSLVFAGEKRARTLNKALRSMDYVPNVLSYQVGKKSGEIIICPSVAARQAPTFGLSVPHYVLFLFIHGLLHLKGHPHGATMEKLERAALARFISPPSLVHFTHGTTHRDRH